MSVSTVPQQTLLDIISIQQAIVEADLRLDDVMHVVVEAAARITHASAAVVELAEGDEMVYRAAAGAASQYVGVHLSRANSLSGLCVKENRPLRCDDSETDERVDREACRRVGARSMIVTPLRHRDRVLGVLKVYSAAVAAFSDGDMSALELLVGLISATMQRAREHERLQKRAAYDQLTGLLNREQLLLEVEQRTIKDDPFVVVYFDIDNFKATNDRHGHARGDDLLRAVGRRLNWTLRRDDVAGRIGGDEFAIVIAGVPSLAMAEAIAERVQTSIGRPVEGDDCDVPISASAGVALYPDDGRTVEALLDRADGRMYEAKRARRQRDY